MSWGAEEKKKIYADMLSELTDSHRNRCLIYDRCCSALGDVSGSQRREEEIPMVPVSMFKEMELRSVPTGAVFKTVDLFWDYGTEDLKDRSG